MVLELGTRQDGTLIADGRADLLDGSLYHSISVKADGTVKIWQSQVWPEQAWTGTNTDGTYAGADCDGWTVDEYSSGAYSFIYASDWAWTYQSNWSCNGCRALYCLEQP